LARRLNGARAAAVLRARLTVPVTRKVAPMSNNQATPDSARERVETGRVRTMDYMQLDPSIGLGLLPVAVFLAVNYLGPAQWAIALSFLTSCFVFVRMRSRGAIQFLSVLGFLIVAGAAVVGLVADSDRAFVAQNIVADFVFAALFAGSALVRRPLIGAIAREAVPAIQPVMPIDLAMFMRLTLLSAALNIVTGIARIVLFQALDANAYTIASRVLGAPLSIGFVVYCYYAITRTAIAMWPADIEPPARRGAATG
jgi:hypothetical protein